MKEILSFLMDFNWITVLIRIALAAIAGGVIGLERGLHGRAAGMRTHMLVCIGAVLTTLLGVYNIEVLGVTWADPLRVGAQVISGVGFLGAGIIMLKKGSSQIQGLTTAAGLWATAVIGLAIGIGFYLGAIVTTAIVVFSFTVVGQLESKVNVKRLRLFVYIEMDGVEAISSVRERIQSSYGAVEIQITPPRSATPGNVGLEALIKIPRKHTVDERIKDLEAINHVVFALAGN
jgi:putative Mg2+ transporter-C (MgtC) family protein